MFTPFKPNPDWYVKQWDAYTEKSAKSPWAVGGTVSILATLLFAAWVGW